MKHLAQSVLDDRRHTKDKEDKDVGERKAEPEEKSGWDVETAQGEERRSQNPLRAVLSGGEGRAFLFAELGSCTDVGASSLLPSSERPRQGMITRGREAYQRESESCSVVYDSLHLHGL